MIEKNLLFERISHTILIENLSFVEFKIVHLFEGNNLTFDMVNSMIIPLNFLSYYTTTVTKKNIFQFYFGPFLIS